MHNEVRNFLRQVQKLYPLYFFRSKVLEVGSLNVNGTVRDFFWFSKEYIGLDIGEGQCVDVVCPVEDYYAGEVFDVVVSVEMLEHCEQWQKALRSMYDNLRPFGLIIFTCASVERAPHGCIGSADPESSPYTNSYYRNISMSDFTSVLPPSMFIQSHISYGRGKQDLYFWGIKK